jgi:hypothetical protein
MVAAADVVWCVADDVTLWLEDELGVVVHPHTRRTERISTAAHATDHIFEILRFESLISSFLPVPDGEPGTSINLNFGRELIKCF